MVNCAWAAYSASVLSNQHIHFACVKADEPQALLCKAVLTYSVRCEFNVSACTQAEEVMLRTTCIKRTVATLKVRVCLGLQQDSFVFVGSVLSG
jgi:hypothetical protein